jgi:aspartyl-tRNA(Asn)/glutamyl-tRNA(Gln) amidotransferase subunit B
VKYEVIIGLEIHVQLKTASKIFCSCSTDFGALPNSQVCPVCLGLPGVLPVFNQTSLEYAARAALVFNCRIASRSIFARKNYFYPDLPKSYQISQYEEPLSSGGFVNISVDPAGKIRKVGITRVHLEEDAGKLLHEGTKGSTLVDFNRCGVPLIEIVTQPDLRSPREAHIFLDVLKNILLYIGISDCNMEEGSLRCDANISLTPLASRDSGALGVKTEIKNMNSFKAVEKALEYEIKRQSKVLEEGARIIQETRLWDENKEITISMRSKEEAHDYRYFPEPDLVPIEMDEKLVARIRAGLPELPEARKARFVKDYKIPLSDAGVLTSSKELADYYEECITLRNEPKAIANWIMSELLRELKEENIVIRECKVSPEHLVEIIALIEKGTISGKMAKELLPEMFQTGRSATEIVEKKGLVQISDEEALAKIVDKILKENPQVVNDYESGKEKAIGYLVGQVMKETKGSANPQIVNRIIKEKI